MSINEIKFLVGRGAAVSAARVKMWRVCYDKISITLADGDSFFLKPFEKASELPNCSDGAMLAFLRTDGKISTVQLTGETNEALAHAEAYAAEQPAPAGNEENKPSAFECCASNNPAAGQGVSVRSEKSFAEKLGGWAGRLVREPIFIPLAVAAATFALVRAALHFLSK